MAISDKQRQILAFPYTGYDALICDGAIRSGKTSFMVLSFIDDAMRRFNHQRFGLCGKTVDSTVKNLVQPYLALSYAKERYNLQWKRTEKTLVVSRGAVENVFEIFGGKDESSFTLIQGRTLAGVLLDEVALQPRSFVEQACARCSVSGSKMWFNCNPESPEHWFYKEWILQPERHNAFRLHFLLEDNPALDAKIIARYKSQYSGVFYDRYIQGLWVQAEGLVYPMFDPGRNVVDSIPEKGPAEWYVSIDYGTLNPCAMLLWHFDGKKAVVVSEYYHDGRGTQRQKTDEEYYQELEKLAGDRPIRHVVVDPSAASFIACIRKHGKFSVRGADNSVIDGIRYTGTALSGGKIQVLIGCVDTIREFGLYRWDEKSLSEDKVIKENDHAMDAVRYFAYTVARKAWKQ